MSQRKLTGMNSINRRMVQGLITDFLRAAKGSVHIDAITRYVLTRYPDAPEGSVMSGVVASLLVLGERKGVVAYQIGNMWRLGERPATKRKVIDLQASLF